MNGRKSSLTHSVRSSGEFEATIYSRSSQLFRLLNYPHFTLAHTEATDSQTADLVLAGRT